MKLSLLILGLLGYSLADRTFKRCQPIADPKLSDKHQPSIDIKNVHQDTHVLLFHITDLPKTNIPFDFNDRYDFQNGDMKLCTQDLINSGECTTEEGFTLTIDKDLELNDTIVNKVIKVGETFHYPIEKPGVFCAIGYHESRKPQLKINHSQPFGFITLEQHIFKDILYYINFFSIGLLMLFISKKMKDQRNSTKHQYLPSTMLNIFLTSLSFLPVYINQYLVLMLKEGYDKVNKVNEFYMGLIINGLLLMNFSITFMGLTHLYAACMNSRSVSEIKNDKLFKVYIGLIVLYPFGTFIKESEQFKIPVVESLRYPSGLLILGITFAVSKIPLNDSKLDLNYKLKFQKTRRLAIFTTIGLWLISFIYESVNVFRQSFRIGDSINETSKLPYYQLKIILTLEDDAKYDVLSVFMNKIEYCAPLIIAIGAIFIWRGVKYDTLEESNGSVDQSTKDVEDDNSDDNITELDNLKVTSQMDNIV
ncbi:putative membrane protein [Wickerhamomyces ciferrii]|uniref:Membrane protein n=1 Tax=Wickerhamomyces ciferrii (strain ATCC 14091 / BCRC 22168 / CBS 111 / JCM 3599 / NBRC 0793 / NRRL Y-1031 F-60-10) TaxID=1206466 RepID=K0KUR4_WICCF|nr:uncharacterized protein BN7_4487 [Wickerhamomyces ciferrii]CCH44918.1 putative membrane protein [Wickerhamomyces ciferrii]